MADEAAAPAAEMYVYQNQQDQNFSGLSADHAAQATAFLAFQQQIQDQALQQHQQFDQNTSRYMEEAAHNAAMMAYHQETTQLQSPTQNDHECQSLGAEEAAQAAALMAYQMQQNQYHLQQNQILQRDIGVRPGSELDSTLLNHADGMFMDQLLDHGSTEQSMILQELMAGNTDPVTAQQLLQILEQQKHQPNISFAATEQSHQMRPDKHYLTISQSGKSSQLLLLGLFNLPGSVLN